jgi:hypothetical protein
VVRFVVCLARFNAEKWFAIWFLRQLKYTGSSRISILRTFANRVKQPGDGGSFSKAEPRRGRGSFPIPVAHDDFSCGLWDICFSIEMLTSMLPE